MEQIHPIQSLIPVGDTDRPLALRPAGPQDEVCGRTLLTRAEDCAGSALDNLDALDGVVQAYKRAVIHEGQERGTVDGRTLDHGREIRRIAAAVGKPGDVDIDAGLSAGVFRPNAWRELVSVGRTTRIRHLNILERRRHDVVAGIEFLHALRIGSHHDFLQWCLGRLTARGSRFLRVGRAAGAPENPGDRGGHAVCGADSQPRPSRE